MNLPFNSSTNAGDLIIVAVNLWPSQVPTCADTAGNVYSMVINTQISNNGATICYAKNIAGGPDTVELGNLASQWTQIRIQEYSGIATSSPFDVAIGATGSSTALNSGATSTKASNELIFGFGVSGANPFNGVAGNGFTARESNEAADYNSLIEDEFVNVTGSYNATESGSSSAWIMQMATFKAATTSIYWASASIEPSQVFRDGQRLTLASSKSSLATGEWWWDSVNSRVYVYDNPSGHAIEASQRTYAIVAPCVGSGSSYMTFSGLQVQMAQDKGIYVCGGAGNIVVTNVLSQDNFGQGIRLDAPANSTITSSTVAYNGQDGIDFYNSANLLVSGNVVHDNIQFPSAVTGNYYSAGIKGNDGSRGSTNVTIQNNLVYSNGIGQTGYLGGGIWIDTIGTGAVIRYNRVYSNNISGIMLDADNGETVYGNVVYGNGYGMGVTGAGEGINAFADGNTTLTNNQVYGNTVFGNYYGGIAFNGPNPVQTSGCTNNTASNNISMGDASGVEFEATYGCENPGTNGSGNVYTYNAFGSPATNFIQWGVSTYESTYSAWETAVGNCGSTGCSHSVQSNPLFTSTSTKNFILTSSSPAIDAGLNLGSTYEYGLDPASTWPSSIILDNQNSNGKGWEIGAYVYPNQATLSVTTSTPLSFSASYGSAATSSQPVVITNTGPASSTLNWSASSTQSWLTFSPASSSLAGGASTTVNFIVNPTGMSLGATSTVATLADPNASSSPQTIPVTLTIGATTSAPPQSLSAVPGNAQVSLSWSTPSSTGGSAITGYLINDKLAASSTYALATTTAATSTVIAGLTNGQLYDFEALAQNGVGTSTPSNVATATPQSNNATLSNLTISTGTLTPAFSSSTTSYTDSVSNSVTSVTVTPTANQASSTITVNSSTVSSGSASSPIALNVGSNTVFTVVTAQNGVAEDTYTITVTRTNVPSVVITAPASSTVSGIVTISASSTAVSPATIASVQFYLDGSPLGSPVTSTSSPNTYSYSWNTASSTNGTHTLYALTTDNYSNTATSTSITVTVANQAVLSVPTSTLTFSAAHGSTSTTPQSIVITNTGAASSTLNWSASSTQSWLTFSKSSSSIAGGASTSVAFIVNPATLALGTYNATATIADPNASSSPQTIPVSLTISSTGVSVSMTSPANGATVTSTISVTANPTSTAGIASLQFLLDGAPLGSLLTSAPYATPWNTALSSNGSHVLMASTTDADSNVATSSSVTVTVQNQAFLSVTTSTSLSFTAAHGSTAPISQSVVIANTGVPISTLNWSASSSQAWLTFSPASSSVAGGASTTISFIANPTNLAIGTYNATATLADPYASSSPQSFLVTLIVSATGIGTSITSPSNSATVSGVVTIAATATSTVGISSVQFYLDGTLIGTATSSPYTTSWNAYVATNGSHILYTLATDNNANTASSSAITVTVANAPPVIVSVGGGGVYYTPPPPSPSASPTATSISTNPSAPPTSSSTLLATLEAELQTLLKEAAAQGINAPGVTGPSPSVSPFAFARNLGLWDRGADVRALQEFLISQASGPAAEQLKAHGVTTVFGLLTYHALQEFQENVGITPAKGYFGAKTRAWVNTH